MPIPGRNKRSSVPSPLTWYAMLTPSGASAYLVTGRSSTPNPSTPTSVTRLDETRPSTTARPFAPHREASSKCERRPSRAVSKRPHIAEITRTDLPIGPCNGPPELQLCLSRFRRQRLGQVGARSLRLVRVKACRTVWGSVRPNFGNDHVDARDRVAVDASFLTEERWFDPCSSAVRTRSEGPTEADPSRQNDVPYPGKHASM